jgi:hypothetical protein
LISVFFKVVCFLGCYNHSFYGDSLKKKFNSRAQFGESKARTMMERGELDSLIVASSQESQQNEINKHKKKSLVIGIDIYDDTLSHTSDISDYNSVPISLPGDIVSPIRQGYDSDFETNEDGAGMVHSTIKADYHHHDDASYSSNRSYQQQTMEITFSFDLSEEQPSPSSVSLPHSADDLSSIIARVPSLELPLLHRHCNPVGSFTVEKSSSASHNCDLPLYKSYCRRRLEEMNRTSCQHNMVNHQQKRSRHSPPTSSFSTSTSNSIIAQRSISGTDRQRSFKVIPRCLLLLCAFVLVMLSVRDGVETSRHYRPSLSLGSRREEIAFPFHGMSSSSSMSRQEGLGTPQHDRISNLPKYYLPKIESTGGSLRATSSRLSTIQEGQSSSNRSRQQHQQYSNIAMARSSQARPIFVPDQPLPDGGFRKPVERFIFDPQQQPTLEYQRINNGPRRKGLSWTSWLATLAFFFMLADTGWKEYRRCRIIEEEQRRL